MRATFDTRENILDQGANPEPSVFKIGNKYDHEHGDPAAGTGQLKPQISKKARLLPLPGLLR